MNELQKISLLVRTIIHHTTSLMKITERSWCVGMRNRSYRTGVSCKNPISRDSRYSGIEVWIVTESKYITQQRLQHGITGLDLKVGGNVKLLWLQHWEIKARDEVRIVKNLRTGICIAGKVKIGWHLRIESWGCELGIWGEFWNINELVADGMELVLTQGKLVTISGDHTLERKCGDSVDGRVI